MKLVHQQVIVQPHKQDLALILADLMFARILMMGFPAHHTILIAAIASHVLPVTQYTVQPVFLAEELVVPAIHQGALAVLVLRATNFHQIHV